MIGDYLPCSTITLHTSVHGYSNASHFSSSLQAAASMEHGPRVVSWTSWKPRTLQHLRAEPFTTARSGPTTSTTRATTTSPATRPLRTTSTSTASSGRRSPSAGEAPDHVPPAQLILLSNGLHAQVACISCGHPHAMVDVTRTLAHGPSPCNRIFGGTSAVTS